MDRLLFGTAGIPASTAWPSSVAGIGRVRELGLDCMELEFVRRVSTGDSMAAQVKEAARKYGVALSAHAPYYLNLNSQEPEKIEASKRRVLSACRAGARCGGRAVVFHPGYYMGGDPKQVYQTVRGHVEDLAARVRDAGLHVQLRPETMGQQSQFGTLEELLQLGRDVPGVLPCVDFAHLHARSGGGFSYAKFAGALEAMASELGPAVLEDGHFHVSGIEYGPRGERRHVNLGESDFPYQDLLRALKDYHVKGVVVCESPNREKDALLLQGTYEGL